MRQNLLYQILFGILIWFALVVFHYLVWRKVLEKINDKFIAPSKHVGGLEGFIGQEGIIKEIEGEKFSCQIIFKECLKYQRIKNKKIVA